MELKKVFACGVSWGAKKPSYFEEFKKHNSAILGSYNRRINKFRNLKVGDLIAAKNGEKIIALGQVASVSESYWSWKNLIDESKANYYGVSLEDEVDVIEVNKWIELEEPINYPTSSGTGFVKNDRSDYLTQCNEAYYKELKKMEKEEIINILKQKKQIILQGAPGTGKTYSTAEIAVNLIDGKVEDDRKEVMKRYNELIKSNQIFFTTFHQSMDYEEFVEGYKPVSNDGNISYEITDGIFKEACRYSCINNDLEKAIEKFKNEELKDGKEIEIPLKTENRTFKVKLDNDKIQHETTNGWEDINIINYENTSFSSRHKAFIEYFTYKGYLKNVVLIIDEINRGNIAKIFGELITLLEADKRKNADNEIEVKLPYSKETFSVPQNLYIIGTMNTTDRSIGYIDYALRRRFAFITMSADRSKIENFYNDKNSDCKDKALKLFDNVEKIIKENLNEEFEFDDIMIGHSYFMAENEEELKRKLDYEIKPLLLEYYKDGILKNNKEVKDKINEL